MKESIEKKNGQQDNKKESAQGYEAPGVYVKTFGGFDLFADGKLVHFQSGKAKELLAVLVDQKGQAVRLSRLAELLFDEMGDEAAAKRAVHMAWHRLKQTLKEHDIEQIVTKGRGVYALDCSEISCDYYIMTGENHSGKKERSRTEYRLDVGENSFTGEYMPEYSWAEVTLSYLMQYYLQKKDK
ncbi:MAG: hypothetical protein Q4F29_06130 [Lachnospiraceae bacterium]|nr:hypothetical protein [Lachnospiraceae bacterium]